MDKTKRFAASLCALLLFSGLAMAAPVSAHDGSSGRSVPIGSAITDDSASGSQTETENHAHDLAEQFKQQARQKLEAEKQTAKQHTEAERQKSCTAHKASLTKRMSKAVSQAQKHKAVFDKIYTRVQDFYTSKNLSVTDYAALKANVDTAQANATASITALKNLDVSVDCSSQTVATSVSAFQQAVKNTRDSLKDYRTSLVNLIKAIKSASSSTSDQ